MIGLSLALLQFRRSKPRIAIAAIMLAAILAPLLLILALKGGQIDAMIANMRNDPSNLEIVLTKDSSLGPEDLARIEGMPGLGYMVPTSRGLSVRAFLSLEDGSGREAISLLPTTAGDPLLLEAAEPSIDQAYVSAALAQATGVAPGDLVRIRTIREGNSQIFDAPVRVLGILPETQLPGTRMMVHPVLVEELESYLEGYSVERLGLSGIAQLNPGSPANARIYAASLEAVAPLEQALSAIGLYARAAKGDVAAKIAIEREAARLSALVAGFLAVGGLLGLWSGLSLNLMPQRRHIALLRLMGAANNQIIAYVTALGCGIGILGTLLAFATYWAISTMLNQAPAFSAQGGQVAELPLQQGVLLSVCPVIAALAVSLVFGNRLLSIGLTEILRNENDG